MLHYLINDTPEEVVVPANSMYIQDGNALFHALKNLPPTFGEICLKVLDQMVALLYLAIRDGNQSGAEKHNRLLFREQ